jgi:acetamidase/formamidase family protein
MTRTISIDRRKPLAEEPRTGHNRWHPDVEPLVEVGEGEDVTLETRDACDGHLTPRSTVADLASVPVGAIHPLTARWKSVPAGVIKLRVAASIFPDTTKSIEPRLRRRSAAFPIWHAWSIPLSGMSTAWCPWMCWVGVFTSSLPKLVKQVLLGKVRGEGRHRISTALAQRLGIMPQNAQLTPWPKGLPEWDSLSWEKKKLFIKQADHSSRRSRRSLSARRACSP